MNTSSPTKLEVGVVGTDVVAGTEQTLHHQGSSHGIEQTKVLRDTTLLGGGGEREREIHKHGGGLCCDNEVRIDCLKSI